MKNCGKRNITPFSTRILSPTITLVFISGYANTENARGVKFKLNLFHRIQGKFKQYYFEEKESSLFQDL